MRQSELFVKTRRTPPRDETFNNAKLLIRGGFIDKLLAGVYTYLPAGLRTLRKIERIVREEINSLGAQEILMPTLHPKQNWQTTGRWDTMDDLYKLSDLSGREFALGGTHEEVIVPLVKQFVASYKDLPFSVYQIQNKFRMELRAKSGVLRGREFIMKDLYSFHSDEEDFEKFYARVRDVYHTIFKRVGIGEQTYFTFAAGGSFSRYSHEFQTVASAGEDIIYICKNCRTAINREIIGKQKCCPKCAKKSFAKERAIEVGNIFPLKTRFSDSFGLVFKDKKGKTHPVLMGCYGIGLGRLLATVVEIHHDESGIVWPASIAPWHIHLITLGNDRQLLKHTESVYNRLKRQNFEVFWDDRDESAGVKLTDSDFMGIPVRLVISHKTGVAKIEYKKREEKRTKVLNWESLLAQLKKGYVP